MKKYLRTLTIGQARSEYQRFCDALQQGVEPISFEQYITNNSIAITY